MAEDEDATLLPVDDAGELDLDQVVSDIDAEIAADLEATGKTAASTDEGDGKGKGAARRATTDPDGDPLEDFVAKNYQGNRAAAVNGFFESRVENKRLSDEISTLRQQVEAAAPQTRDLAADLAELRKTDPDVLSFNREITETTNRNKAITARQGEIITKARELDVEIIELEAEIAHIEDPKEANKKLVAANRKRNEVVALTNEYNTNELRLEKNDDKIKTDKRELRRAEQALQQQLVDEVNQARTNDKGGVVTRRTFEAAFDHFTGPLKIDRNTKQGKFAHAAIRSQLADHLDSLGEDNEGLDAHGIFEVVKSLVEDYAEAHNIKVTGSRPAGANPQPRRMLLPPPPKGARADAAALRQNKASEAIFNNPDAIRRRAAAIDQATAVRRRATS